MRRSWRPNPHHNRILLSKLLDSSKIHHLTIILSRSNTGQSIRDCLHQIVHISARRSFKTFPLSNLFGMAPPPRVELKI